METALSPKRVMEHALGSDGFMYDFVVRIRKLEQILRNMDYLHGGLNGNTEAPV